MKKLFLKVELNENDPIKGIFDNLLSISDIIVNKIVIINESTFYGYGRKHADCLVYRKKEIGWASDDYPNQYFDIYFTTYSIKMTNYSFLSTKGDDEVPRNWKVMCLDHGLESLIVEESNNDRLCDGISGLNNFCPKYDVKAYGVSNRINCRHLRFQQTGINSSGRNFFVLSGVELFGSLFYLGLVNTFSFKKLIPHLPPLFFSIIVGY